MTTADALHTLDQLIEHWEGEVVEFKEASNDYDTDRIGQYFSALSNEANLRNSDAAWLVFGVNDKTRTVTGSNYRPQRDRLDSLKHQISQNAGATFREIHEVDHTSGRVILFEIPPAPRGLPIPWKGHYWARAGQSLIALSDGKRDEIRAQTLRVDWTAAVVDGATLHDLDPAALARARDAYIARAGARVDEEVVRSWPIEVFTDRVGLTQSGAVTRTALLLVGKPESAWKLSPHPAQITWSLEGPERAYEHFKPPFLLTSSEVFQRIRNIRIRLLPTDQLVATEISKYDQRVVLEALHNCITHQDYTRDARIVVRELPDRLVFENEGSFYEGQPEEYASGTKRPRRYRNPFLAQAMVELNMIDSLGYGIHHMNREQARRYLPLPAYEIAESDVVRLTIFGGVVDTNYTAMLLTRTDLDFSDVLALDRVQKRLPIPDDAVYRLRRAGLIEGRRPNLHVAAAVAAAAGSQVDYIRTRAQDDEHYTKLVLDYLEKFGSCTRQEINRLLLDKLSDALTPQQKEAKIHNLLSKLRRKGLIETQGSRRSARWRLRNPDSAHS
ncbi:RNA-binding domain-containing protein [Microbacterium aurantiacum]|uniref:RNA-binding domain-containing protein n=1 Tax=Microbacterium aurantiacum TaxID=162393 RepID=UPI003437F5A6